MREGETTACILLRLVPILFGFIQQSNEAWIGLILNQGLETLVFACCFIICLLILISFYRAENMARKTAGEDPLPEEDPANPIFKPIPEPSRLDSFLITNQISNYCNQINGYATELRRHSDIMSCHFLQQGILNSVPLNKGGFFISINSQNLQILVLGLLKHLMDKHIISIFKKPMHKHTHVSKSLFCSLHVLIVYSVDVYKNTFLSSKSQFN